jgi:uroporphyrinogen decarboxylase
VDRPPFGYGLGFGPWEETLERWRRESGIPDLDVSRYFGYEPTFCGVPINMGPWPPFVCEVLAEDEHTVTRRDVFGVVQRSWRVGHGVSVPQFLDHPVHNRRDWEQYKEERLRPDAPGRFLKPGGAWNPWHDVPWEADTAEAVGRAAAATAAEQELAVQVGGFPWGVFGTARLVLGVESLLVSFYTQPDLVRDIMGTFTGLWLDLLEQVAPFVRLDRIHLWEDMAGRQGSLISPAMVEEFMMPHYRRIRVFAKAHGIRLLSVDSDGRVDDLVPLMVQNGMNVMEPFEVQAGSDVEAFRRQYPTLGMVGGLDKRALGRGRAAINAEIARAERMLESGRYIPGMDHFIPPDAPWESFLYYVNRLKDVMGMTG